ncbi:glycosyltransferase [Chitinophaga sedimenti]|uniref:glycosyltransferase n=1 Tax=Chitinophaga sedimenti TaxID=2033606 RepID=UPI002002A0EF|nr:nucleotide disphospho-sugar-binding domain-containing protein [Chitinophaga sedimenti]MCK7555010.1 glycosyltransferase [Chitinophaga sedimenti]
MSQPRVLFAHVPFDGHYYPLTGLAMYLVEQGYDVRWYSGTAHAEKIAAMGIPVFPFKRAVELNQSNTDELFPERRQLKGKIAKLKFDVRQFIARAPEYYEDLQEIKARFPFDVLVCDAAFTGACLVKALMRIPVVAVGVFPLSVSSRDLPPNGMGLTPARNGFEKLKHAGLRWMSRNVLFAGALKQTNRIFTRYGVNTYNGLVFDVLPKRCDLLLQSGAPGFEYQRSDLPNNVRFVGSLLPFRAKAPAPFHLQSRLASYGRIILVTQGTVEKDPEKLLVPTLEAFKDTPYMVVATTGGFNTALLRKRFPQNNIIIEDYIDFDGVMPLVNVYVTNGGYGGVMQAVSHQLPLVVAGLHEGKNEINARVGYFKLGIDLRTERPTAWQVRSAIEKVLSDHRYKENVRNLARELERYHPGRAAERYIKALLHLYQQKR